MAAGHAVDVLVTVDPVSWRRPDFADVKKHAGKWYNYYSTATNRGWSDVVAWLGRHWKDAPEGFADTHRRIDMTHAGICRWLCVPKPLPP